MLRYEKNEGRRMVVGVIRTPDRNVVMCVKEPLDVTFYASREEVLNSPIDEVRQHSPSMAFEMGLEGATPTVRISGKVSQMCLMALTEIASLGADYQKNIFREFSKIQERLPGATYTLATGSFFVLGFLDNENKSHTIISDYSEENINETAKRLRQLRRNTQMTYREIRDELRVVRAEAEKRFGSTPILTEKTPFLSCNGPIAEVINTGMALDAKRPTNRQTSTGAP